MRLIGFIVLLFASFALGAHLEARTRRRMEQEAMSHANHLIYRLAEALHHCEEMAK